MRTVELDYDLPEALIATRPLPERDGARLLTLGPDGVSHGEVRAWPGLVEPGSLVVLNETRVIKARLLGRRRASGGRVEVLLVRPLAGADGGEGSRWEALARANRGLRPGVEIEVGTLLVRLVARGPGGTWVVELEAPGPLGAALEREGHVPIPPYLKRADDAEDVARYQTVFARTPGSVAAPTAGLHLTPALLAELERREVRLARLTLHVGLGTFRPVAVEDLGDHDMHTEEYVVGEDLAEAVADARRRGAPVVAVGTTVVRALESAACPEHPGEVRPTAGATRLLITPGYHFRVVDALLTNFHQPRSTLLALVGAFAGLPRVREAYRIAIAEQYRFLSYGDAMWIPRRM